VNPYSVHTDAELLSLLKQDDARAFGELYDRHSLSLFDIAYKRLKDRQTSEDIVHDVYTDLWDKRHTRDIQNLLPYLHTATRNAIYTLLSKGRATAHFVEPFEDMAVSGLTADGFLNSREIQELLVLLMNTLPKKRREIFRLRYLEGHTTKEISEELDISQKTVQNQLLNAVNSFTPNLREILGIIILLKYF